MKFAVTLTFKSPTDPRRLELGTYDRALPDDAIKSAREKFKSLMKNLTVNTYDLTATPTSRGSK